MPILSHMAAEHHLAGVGLVLPLQMPGCNWVFAMEFDCVPVHATTSIRLREVVEMHEVLDGPYADVSPSGQGIRMLLMSTTALRQTRQRRSADGTMRPMFPQASPQTCAGSLV